MRKTYQELCLKIILYPANLDIITASGDVDELEFFEDWLDN